MPETDQVGDEALDEVPIDLAKMAVVMIAKPECLDCHHLIPNLRDTCYPCLGERNCPAVTLRVEVGVDLKEYSDGLADGWANDNLEQVSAILGRLTTLHPAIRGRVLSLAKSKMLGRVHE